MYQRIRDLREDHDLSQEQLAQYLNVHQTTYSSYEIGRLDVPVDVMGKLADFYGTSVDYLMGRTFEMKPYPKK
ncbi:MAG: helix-turn-helix transcriptional regulator [Peptococcaceae bacterium]|jgi:transcriptional regulator with XRE-family HTH domain|nr:helix-turn-helix transcriptional regulator [Peptococcaceae bacterium]